MKIKSSVKAGGLTSVNHSSKLVAVKSQVKAGGLSSINHAVKLAR